MPETPSTGQPKPSHPGEWSLAQVQAALSRPLPKNMIATRKQGGATLEYIPWHLANKILDKYAPGWQWEISKIETTIDRIFVVGKLTLLTNDGYITREATGTEELKETVKDKNTGQPVTREHAYGDPSSNAESMAFRRAAAKFGLGLYLYDK